MRERKAYIQNLSVIACFCVVLMHVNNAAAEVTGDSIGAAHVVIEGVCYFAVPVFFMISGANLIDYRKRYSTATFFQKRILKTLVPFVFWTLVGMIFLSLIGYEVDFSAKGIFIHSLINVEYISTYWFFIPLFMSYLIIPILNAIVPKEKIFAYMILLGILFAFMIPFLRSLTGDFLNEYFDIPMLRGFTLYLLIGYYIDHFSLPKWLHIIIYALGAVSLYLMTAQTVAMIQLTGYNYGLYKGVLNLPVLLYASAMMLLFHDLKGSKAEQVTARITSHFAPATLGVYLLHRFFIELLKAIPGFLGSTWQTLLGAAAIFVVAAVVVRLLQKIPGVRWILP